MDAWVLVAALNPSRYMNWSSSIITIRGLGGENSSQDLILRHATVFNRPTESRPIFFRIVAVDTSPLSRHGVPFYGYDKTQLTQICICSIMVASEDERIGLTRDQSDVRLLDRGILTATRASGVVYARVVTRLQAKFVPSLYIVS